MTSNGMLGGKLLQHVRRLLAALALLAASQGCSEQGAAVDTRAGGGTLAWLDRYASGPSAAWGLPKELREISGLAVSGDGRLFAHNDERAVIHELDARGRRILKSFALGEGRKPLRGDFEGLAIAQGKFYLITSDGTLYESQEGTSGAMVPYTEHRTALGRLCEIEGLTYEPSDSTLLAPCKTPRDGALRGRLTVFRWQPNPATQDNVERLQVPLEALRRAGAPERFHPTAIEREPTTAHYLLIAAQERTIAEITAQGELVSVRPLREQHRQAEGMALLPDGTLIIADEGGSGPGTLTLYPPKP